MKKEIALFLLALTLYSAARANDRGPGTVFLKKDGTNEYVKSFEEKDGKVKIVPCKGQQRTLNRSDVEFFAQSNVCAKISIDAYSAFLNSTKDSLVSSQIESIVIFVPPEQNFEQAAKVGKEVFGDTAQVVRGSTFRVSARVSHKPKNSTLAEKRSATGKSVWVDPSGFLEITNGVAPDPVNK